MDTSAHSGPSEVAPLQSAPQILDVPLAIVIVNYRVSAMVIQSVNALLTDPSFQPCWQILIVDNFSSSAEIDALAGACAQKSWSPYVTFIKNPHNSGFGAGNNLALTQLFTPPAANDPAPADKPSPDYVFFLNPDAQTTADHIQTLLHHMETHPACGSATSRIIGEDGTPDTAAFNFPTLRREFFTVLGTGHHKPHLRDRFIAPPDHPSTRPCDWASGASLMMRTRTLLDVGGFDENYFLYFEETDLQYRAAQKGWQTWYVADAVTHHTAGASTGLKWDNSRPPARPPYWYRSWIYYHCANHGRLYAFMVLKFIILAALLHMFIRTARGKSLGTARGLIRHLLRFGLPFILSPTKGRNIPFFK